MTSQRHVIKRQTVEIKVTREQDAWPLQQEIGRIVRERVPQLIDRCCTAASAPDRLHRIERLELDLGSIAPSYLEAELTSRIEEGLQRQLVEHIVRLETATLPPDQSPAVASHLELLGQLAREGSLPWWADLARPRLLEGSLDALLNDAPTRLKRLMRELASDERALQRLIRHLDDARLARLAALAGTSRPAFQEALFTALRWAQRDTPPLARFAPMRLRVCLWQSILQVATAAGPLDRLAFIQAVLLRLAAMHGPGAAGLALELCRALASTPSDIGALATALAGTWSEAARLASVSSSAEEPGRDVLAGETDSSQEPGFVGDEDTAPEIPPSGADASGFGDADAVYLGNAGLVILAPFLERFFERTALVSHGRFRDSEAAQRGVALLQYLAGADLAPPEYWLPLNKLLCGMAPEDAFIIEDPLTALEIQACEALLEAVIEQAPILNHMSVAGFRGTFLLRRGVLSADAGVWLLRVERETYDLVLERFPWRLDWVRLPWMTLPLRVEW